MEINKFGGQILEFWLLSIQNHCSQLISWYYDQCEIYDSQYWLYDQAISGLAVASDNSVVSLYSPVENDMDPDIFDNKQIFVLNTLYWCQIAPKKIQPKSTLGKYVF